MDSRKSEGVKKKHKTLISSHAVVNKQVGYKKIIGKMSHRLIRCKKQKITEILRKCYLGIQTGESDIAGDSIFSGITGVLS